MTDDTRLRDGPVPREHAQELAVQDSGGIASAGRDTHGSVYAALDLGTNNCRLLIAQPTGDNNFRVIDSFSRIIRLGEGVSLSGVISEAAIARAIVRPPGGRFG